MAAIQAPARSQAITDQTQSKPNNFTLIMTRCVCQYTSSQDNSLTAFNWAAMTAVYVLLYRFGWIILCHLYSLLYRWFVKTVDIYIDFILLTLMENCVLNVHLYSVLQILNLKLILKKWKGHLSLLKGRVGDLSIRGTWYDVLPACQLMLIHTFVHSVLAQRLG